MRHYTVHKIDDDEISTDEPAGAKRKLWFYKGKELFKEGRPGTGENWAEVFVADVCTLLKLPHAKYKFAIYKKMTGVLSENIVPAGGQLIFGNQILSLNIINKPEEYTISRTCARLMKFNNHIGLPQLDSIHRGIIKTPLDLFAGYLLLDALVGNHDRHWENWGIIADLNAGRLYLAPTFDHASSLGRELDDNKRLHRLFTTDKRCDMMAYARRGKTPFYGSLSPISTQIRLSALDVFKYIYNMTPSSSKHWISILDVISENSLNDICSQMPENIMSNASKKFAINLILINKERLNQISN